MEIITKFEAYGRGLKRFYTGVLCKHGHDCERYLGNHGCVECSRISSTGPLKAKNTTRYGNPVVKARKTWAQVKESLNCIS